MLSAVSEKIDPETGEVLPRRRWLGELAVSSAVLDKLQDDGNPKRRRRLLRVSTLGDALAQVQQAAGHAVVWLRRPPDWGAF